MILILLGPPGVGKGTQAKLIAKKFNIRHLSTGDILRSAVATGSALGKKVNDYLQKGNLVPDDVMVEVIAEELGRPLHRNGFILDGFPRTIAQAEALEKILARLNLSIDAVLNFEADESELIRRLSRRRMCRRCQSIFNLDLDSASGKNNAAVCPRCGGELYQRDDDKEETVKNRLKVYIASTAPLQDFYAKKNLLITLHGEGKIDQIFENIIGLLAKHHEKR